VLSFILRCHRRYRSSWLAVETTLRAITDQICTCIAINAADERIPNAAGCCI
jgi:hypothetical protein